jgi:hypothetical protein
MRKETAMAITRRKSQANAAIRDGVLGAVVLPPRTLGPIPILAGNINRITGALALLFFGCFSAKAYTSLGSNLYQSNGSQADTQSALSAASAGSTVQIANGSYTWTSPVTISRDVSLKGQSAGGVTITDSYDSGNWGGNSMVHVSNPTPFAVTVSNIAFKTGQQSSGSAILLELGTPALIHDCTFDGNSGILRSVLFAGNGGVLWNCTFRSGDNDVEQIGFKNSAAPLSTWASPSTMGTNDVNGQGNTYVEDCTFVDCLLEACDPDDNSRVVIRHNTFNNSGMCSHGQDTSPVGTRHWEIYNNSFIFTASGTTPFGNQYPINLNYFFFVRGGTGVIFNNSFDNISSQQWGNKASILWADYNIQRTASAVSCQTTYPSARQVGQTWVGGNGYSYPGAPTDGAGYGTDPVYLWNNTGAGGTNVGWDDYSPDQCGNNLLAANFIRVGRDFILGLPKPGYTPFTYPHPLRTGAGSPAPTPIATPPPPQNLHIVPVSALSFPGVFARV